MEALINVPLLKNEIVIDTWDLYYSFSNGLVFFGGITITNKRIFFETKIKGGIEAMLAASSVFTNHTPNHVVLSKKHITHIETVKDITGNKAILTLSNNEKHTLNRKMLSIEKIVEALEKK
jgi:hypothetical protein